MSENINPINNSFFPSFGCVIDYEYARIIRKLAQYGLKPSGSKSHDKQRLHEIELKEKAG